MRKKAADNPERDGKKRAKLCETGFVKDSCDSLPSDRDERIYKALSPRPERWKDVSDAIIKMWETEPQITGKLGQIAVPVLVVADDHDLIQPEHTKMIASSIAGTELFFVQDASHIVVWQQPEAFSDAVKAILGVD